MGWYEALKDVLQVADRLKNAELKQMLASVQVECAKLAEENARLREDLLKLREVSEMRMALVFRDNVYWQVKDGVETGPYCPKCKDGDAKVVRLMHEGGAAWWTCPVCRLTPERSPQLRALEGRGSVYDDEM